MRISDWSSDVCSSDLAQAKRPEPGTVPNSGLGHLVFNCPTSGGQFKRGHFYVSGAYRFKHRRVLHGPRLYSCAAQPALERESWCFQQRQQVGRQDDRKSVGTGMRVSVRGNLVGRRIVKKKKIIALIT